MGKTDPDIVKINDDIEHKLCNNRMNITVEYNAKDRKLLFKFDIQTQLDDDIYDTNMRKRLKSILFEPTVTFGTDKLVYPMCKEDSK
jgi:hypothetical protein